LAADLPTEIASHFDINHEGVPDEPEMLSPFTSRVVELPNESEPYWGYIPFELTVSVFGQAVTLDFRASFVGTLYDEADPTTGETYRAFGSSVIRYELLEWLHPDGRNPETGERLRNSVPRWVQADIAPLLPPLVEMRIDDMVDDELRALEAAKIATSN
jgi:hypothetical protein